MKEYALFQLGRDSEAGGDIHKSAQNPSNAAAICRSLNIFRQVAPLRCSLTLEIKPEAGGLDAAQRTAAKATRSTYSLNNRAKATQNQVQ
jgi:hypothetical protein